MSAGVRLLVWLLILSGRPISSRDALYLPAAAGNHLQRRSELLHANLGHGPDADNQLLSIVRHRPQYSETD